MSRPRHQSWFTLVLILAAGAFGQARQVSSQGQFQIHDPVELVGKKINVQRLPLCHPGTYTVDVAHSGKEATVVSAKRSGTPALPASALNRLAPELRDLMLDQQKAALLLLQFEDGTKLDTCAPFGPKRLAQYIEVLPGQDATQPAPPGEAGAPAGAAPPEVQSNRELSDAQVKAAMNGEGRNRWADIQDMGLSLSTPAEARSPSISLYMPEALIAIKAQSAKKQFLKYEPSEGDRQLALTVVAQGSVAETVQGGCVSVTRVVLLSDPSGSVVKEAYQSEPLSETWRNAFGASNSCQTLRAKFWLDDVQEVRSAAKDGEFYVAVFSGAKNTKTYKIKHKHQSSLGLGKRD